MADQAEIRWESTLGAWYIQSARPVGPAGRVIIDLGAGVSVHVDRVELGRIVLVEILNENDRTVGRAVVDRVRAVGGDQVADMLVDAKEGRSELPNHGSGWLAGLSSAVSQSDGIRRLWHAEAAMHLADAPTILRLLARQHALQARPALEALATHLPVDGRVRGQAESSQQLSVLAATVSDLLDGDVSDAVAELAVPVRAPEFAESSDARNTEIDYLSAGGTTRSAEGLGEERTIEDRAFPVAHIEQPVRLIHHANWYERGNHLDVHLWLRVKPTVGELGCWAETVTPDGQVLDRCAISFESSSLMGSAVLAKPAGNEFEVQVTVDRDRAPMTAKERIERRARSLASEVADDMRDLLRSASPSGWSDASIRWMDIARLWESSDNDERASIARELSQTCLDYQSAGRLLLMERLGPGSVVRALKPEIRADLLDAQPREPGDTRSAYAAVLEGTWSTVVRRLGHTLWSELRVIDPEAAADDVAQTTHAGLTVSDDDDIELVADLLDELAKRK